jgi:type II secretion system protein I
MNRESGGQSARSLTSGCSGHVSRFPFLASRFAFRNSASGFTLLEVLVAIAIVGIAVTAIVELFSSNLRAISTSEDQVRASLAAEARMREVLDDKGIAEKAWSEVTTDGYRVDVAVKKVHTDRAETIGVALLQVDLSLSWRRGIKNRTIRLSTLKAVYPGETGTNKAAG